MDVVTAFGLDYLSGIVYVGGPIVALHYLPQFRHPVMNELFPIITSLTSDDLSDGGERFVDSCVARPLSFEEKLSFMGGFLMQPRAARYWSIKRNQDHTVWEATARPLPVIIIQGEEDLHCVYDVMIGIARRVYDRVEVKMMSGIGHSPHIENAEETNRAIEAWVTEVAAE